MSEEFVNEGQDFNTEAADENQGGNTGRDERTWTLDDGTEVSMSEFVRERFTKDNMSRKEISEQYDINYRTVYGATVNMTNDAEPASRGRSAANQKIQVTNEGQVVTKVEDTFYLDGEAISEDEANALDTQEVDRNDWIKEQVEAGVSRGDVANKLGLSYGVIYNITKDIAGASQRHEIEYNGETMSRSEYIRTRYQEGMAKADIAKELEVDYPVVWSALKVLKTDQEKLHDAIDRLGKTASNLVADQDALDSLLEQLKGLEVKEEASNEDSDSDSDDGVYAE